MMKTHENNANFRIVVVGAKSTGKSAVVVRYLTGRFINDYGSGIDVAYTQNVLINNEHINLHILDTSGPKMSQAALAWADGVIVVYAIDSRKSFHKAKELLEEVRTTNNRNAVTTVIATKSELWSCRTVLKHEGEELAKQYGCQHFEVSATEDYNSINRLFLFVNRKMLKLLNNDEKDRTPVIIRKLLHRNGSKEV